MEPDARRTMGFLSAAYALLWVAVSMVAGPGSAELVRLSGHLSHAGLFFAIYAVSAAAGAALGGMLMDRAGRRTGLIAAYVVTAAGFFVAGRAVGQGSLATFVVGTAILAAGAGAVNLTRVAVAELFPPSERGRAVGWLQLSALAGAVMGPGLLVLTEPVGRLLGREPLGLVWYAAPPLLLLAAFLVARARLARAGSKQPGAPAPAAPAQVAAANAASLIAAGVVALTASQAAMVAVMAVAGAAVDHAGHGVRVLGTLMLLHFVGMFGLSRVVGRTADRLGRRITILAGLGLMASGGLAVAVIPGPAGFGAGLLLVGVGWSFGYIGASVLLTDVTAPARRARVIGRADLVSQFVAAGVATAGGWWFARNGVTGLGVLAIVVVAAPFVWLLLVRERTPGVYGGAASA